MSFQKADALFKYWDDTGDPVAKKPRREAQASEEEEGILAKTYKEAFEHEWAARLQSRALRTETEHADEALRRRAELIRAWPRPAAKSRPNSCRPIRPTSTGSTIWRAT